MLRLAIAAALAASVSMLGLASAPAEAAGERFPTVRLCPVTCFSVSYHPYTLTSKLEVFETRSGWARISPYLDRPALVLRYGEKVPETPAHWIRLSTLKITGDVEGIAGDGAPSAAASSKPRERARNQRQKRLVTLPVHRPDSATAALPIETVRTETAALNETTQQDSDSTIEQASQTAVEPKPTTAAVQTLPNDSFTLTAAPLQPSTLVTPAQTPSRPAVVEKLRPTQVALNPVEPEGSTGLTDDKMAAWIAANRGSVLAKVKNDVEPELKLSPSASVEQRIEALKQPASASVPTIMTLELLDERLAVLPGMNSDLSEKSVITLRHHALQLLKDGKCSGIAGGKVDEAAGTIQVVCSDDLTTPREFQLEQISPRLNRLSAGNL
ncbi:MAG: hypothetical protein OXR62_11645 [Ahrensia sp.]|nr:hypothetical protein [Ahrensia sp.]